MGLPAVAEMTDGGAMTDIPRDAIRQGHEGNDADRVLNEATVVASATGQWTGETHIRGPLGRSLTMHQSDELLAARDASEQANAAKSQFLAHMSHELRTPLTAIIGFSRVLEVSQVDVGALAVDVIADLDGRERSPGVELRADVPPDAAMLAADATKLRQVPVNLVGNALKFTLEGSVVVALETNADGSPKSMTVTDTGVGIAPEHQASVFEPFAQEDTTISRRFGGTGLGLAISKRYCEMMGFSLTLESEVGRGSVFRICFGRETGG